VNHRWQFLCWLFHRWQFLGWPFLCFRQSSLQPMTPMEQHLLPKHYLLLRLLHLLRLRFAMLALRKNLSRFQ
jgi:hypothetical protein